MNEIGLNRTDTRTSNTRTETATSNSGLSNTRTDKGTEYLHETKNN